MPKLTKRVVESAEPRAKPYLIFDDEVHGFALRVFKSGERHFLMRYRFGGADRKMRLGRFGDITADEARKLALKARVALADGIDPGAARRKLSASPTLKDLSDRFLREQVAVRCKPCTQGDYKHALKVVEAKLGRRRVAEVTRADIAELHHSLQHKPYLANRVLSILSKMFNLADLWGLRAEGSNPCHLVKKYPENKRERFLTAEELRRLGLAFENSKRRLPDGEGNYVLGPESPYVIAAFKLLILTGCRLSEIQTLKWDYVREDRLELPDSKTGAKVVPLGNEAVAVLESITAIDGNPYVIVGEVEGQHITAARKRVMRDIGTAFENLERSLVEAGKDASLANKLRVADQVQNLRDLTTSNRPFAKAARAALALRGGAMFVAGPEDAP